MGNAARAACTLVVVAGAAFGQTNFAWDYAYPGGPVPYNWASNGSLSAASGGSGIWTATVSGTNPNDYDVDMGVYPLAGATQGGTFMQILRASTTTVLPGTGSYISVEITPVSDWQSGESAALVVNQCVNGTVSQIGGTTVALHSGDVLRSVIFGTNLLVYLNNVQVGQYTVPTTSGQPGYGGYSIPSGAWSTWVFRIGHHDTVAPNSVLRSGVATSLLPTNVSLKWQPVSDDPVGIGVWGYIVSRNGQTAATVQEPEFGDSTVAASTSYTYTVQPVDYHGNAAAATTITVTTPPAGAVDPRRIGLYSTGSYWGGGGEQIDTLSGNLHFTIPLGTATGRTGWSVPINLVYDSQNWRNDNGVNWNLGADVGFGFGWKQLIGSVTPYYANEYGAADHFVYTDATGAQYRLDQNNSGVWTTSTQTAYVWLDTTVSPYRLHFPDGKFWVLGSTSGGLEQDAGTMYPTTIEDTSGNQVIIEYDTGLGLPYYYSGYELIPTPNTSSRIWFLWDSRGQGSYSYVFTYDRTHYTIPHLTSFTGPTTAGASISYTTVTQEPPFGSDPNFGGTTTLLTQGDIGYASPWTFTYDTAGAGEMQSAIFPFGGEIAWNYSSFEYIGGRSMRQVSARYLAPDALHQTSPMWSYGISWPDAPNSVILHSGFTLTDASGVGAKTWTFNTTGSPWQLGLVTDFKQLTAANGTAMHDDEYTWSQDPAGHPYISAHTSITDPGQSYQQSALTTQTVDKYGNVTQSAIYPYNNTTAAVKTYNSSYLTDAGHLTNYVFNLLSSAVLTPAGGSPVTLVANAYDGCVYNCFQQPPQGSPTPTQWDSNSPVPVTSRGLLYTSSTPAKTTGYLYYAWGMPAYTSGSDGVWVSTNADPATNYAAPTSITVQNYTTTVGYTAWLGVAQTTGPNGDQLTMTYDQYGRPTSGTSAYGAVTYFGYSTSAPFEQSESGPNGSTGTTLDGFGRAVLVQTSTSNVASVYAPCACSPLGKLQKTSMPYPTGGSASAWTTYTYDGLGRTVSVQKPDGASTTYYNYAGNQTTVTDPAGKWKTSTRDVEGNLITVLEPDPANQPGGTLTTNYTYDWMGHVTQVSMPRAGTTQTRTFVYDCGFSPIPITRSPLIPISHSPRKPISVLL